MVAQEDVALLGEGARGDEAGAVAWRTVVVHSKGEGAVGIKDLDGWKEKWDGGMRHDDDDGEAVGW